MTISPKLTQDQKRRVFEVDDDGNIKINENGAAGNDPTTGGHDPNTGNMADKTVNKLPIGQAVGVKETPKPTEEINQAKNEDTANQKTEGDCEPPVDVSKRVTRSAVRRGRPRRRGVSMDPPLPNEQDDVMQVLLNIQERMANAQIEREKFNNDTLSSIDNKFQTVKDSVCASVSSIQSDMKNHGDMLTFLHSKHSDHDIQVSDAEVRLDELENEL